MKKKIISSLLAAVMLLSAPATAGAASSWLGTAGHPDQGVGLVSSSQTYEEVSSYDKNLLGQEIYDVTDKDVQQFEEKYEKENGVKKASEETVAQAAQKRAAMLTQLYGVSSVQYALIEDGKITVSGQAGYDSRKDKLLPTQNSMYGIGSISKIFTTVAVMKLVEEGKIDLDQTVVNYVPKFTMADSRYRDMTVRMLLNHSSGLMGGGLSNALLFNDKSTVYHDNFLKSLKTQRLKADPGAFSVYSNDGFTLAEIVVEEVTGKGFSQYIDEIVSGPMGLSNTKTPQDSFKRTRLAGIYNGTEKTSLPADVLAAIGAGGMYSTAENLCQFSKAFMHGSDLLLSADSLKAMEAPEYKNGLWYEEDKNTFSYGLGWDSIDTYPFNKYNIKALVKGGDTLYYHGGLIVLPEENMAVAVLSSDGSSTVDEVFGQSILLDALQKKGKITSVPEMESFDIPEKAEVPTEELAYKGIYGNYMGLFKADLKAGGILEYSNVYAPQAGTVKFQRASDGYYYTSDKTARLSFIKEKNGKTYLCQGGYSNLPGIGQNYLACYLGEQMESNKVSNSVQKAWDKRMNKIYFTISERYSSQHYVRSALFSQMAKTAELPGYVINAKITGKNTAKLDLQIPMVFGRDLTDYKFTTKNNVEYLTVGGITAIAEDYVKSLSTKKKFNVKIAKDGYAKWYTISKKSAGKKVKIALSNKKKGAFTVYKQNGTCLNHSYISGKKTVTLPKNGYIVFAGDKEAKFTVQYQK